MVILLNNMLCTLGFKFKYTKYAAKFKFGHDHLKFLQLFSINLNIMVKGCFIKKVWQIWYVYLLNKVPLIKYFRLQVGYITSIQNIMLSVNLVMIIWNFFNYFQIIWIKVHLSKNTFFKSKNEVSFCWT